MTITEKNPSSRWCPDGPPCSNCGMNPCSYQCRFSPHYYSPEQERADEPFSDRYDGWGDPETHEDWE